MKKSLPAMLCRSLEQHAKSSDIEYDEELTDIMNKLTSLNQKVEEIKARAKLNKQLSNVVDINKHRK